MSRLSDTNAQLAGPDLSARLAKRRASERRFRLYGRASIGFAVVALAWLLLSIVSTGVSAFVQPWVTLDLSVNAAAPDDRRALADALLDSLEADSDPQSRRDVLGLVSSGLATRQVRDARAAGQTRVRLDVPLSDYSRLDARQQSWLQGWREAGRVERRFDTGLFTNADSRDPARAGLASALFGSVMIVLISGLVAIPVGVGAAIYLDAFAPRSGWRGWATRAVEVNINNLAAVPAIVFGLLGLAVFINLFGLARSIPLVGGLVMALRMFPTVVIASRAALQAVPESLTDSALSLGASRMQAVFGHKVPVAAPAMLTGSIIGMAQALGETAPLLMIGMVAFVTSVPGSPLDPATALPVQIYLWSGSAEAAWAQRASAAIMVLLGVLLAFNALAVILRERLQRRDRL